MMSDGKAEIHTGGGTYVDGSVQVTGGDFVGRDQIETLIQRLEQMNVEGDYVERQEITQVFLVVPGAQEAAVKWMAEQQGVDSSLLQNLGAGAASEHIDRQILELEAAQRRVEAQGVPLPPKAAYRLGLLAAYRRDYEVALAYLQQATQIDPEYSDAFVAIAQLQQSRAMIDRNRKDLDAAMAKLTAARRAVRQTDPLDARAMALRGYIAKTLAQVSKDRRDQAGRDKYYAEAARFFEQAVNLDPQDASACNGLGNVQYARGNLDAAIEAYTRAIELAPYYAPAHHDLSLAYQAKMQADPAHATEWCQRALSAWEEAYHLAPEDPGFPADYILEMGKHLNRLKRRCG